MKKFLYIPLFAFSMLLALPSQAANIERTVQTLCDYAKTNNRSAIRKRLKEARINLKAVYDAIQCGAGKGFEGGSLLKTATFFGAEHVAKFLIIRLGEKGLKNLEDPNFAQWGHNLIASGKTPKPAAVKNIIEKYREKTAS
ncbi:MAG: DUF3718 domain-containing protein [Gammaproteobacteria bacterium]|nr:MAG: DUF3718 domain-containing protein [Gammaproteobacteria bacterium]